MSENAIVVGAGIFGVSIANQLAGDGWQVTLVDQDEPGNERATSSSLSRVIRFGHGADTWYTRLAWRARTLWKQLEEETGTSLLVEAGMVWFVQEHEDGGGLADHSEAALRAEGIPVERLAPAEVAALYPSLDAGDPTCGAPRSRWMGRPCTPTGWCGPAGRGCRGCSPGWSDCGSRAASITTTKRRPAGPCRRCQSGTTSRGRSMASSTWTGAASRSPPTTPRPTATSIPSTAAASWTTTTRPARALTSRGASPPSRGSSRLAAGSASTS